MSELGEVVPPNIRRGAVFFVTAVGAFMASLDLSIVNVAFRPSNTRFPTTTVVTLLVFALVVGVVTVAALPILTRPANETDPYQQQRSSSHV